jgi:lysophospholipid acyltransferase (LPLAT)-like uncharacterized protein
VKPGIVYLASQTGIPIVANTNAVSRYWDIAGSWTNQIVPKPFSKVILLTGTPIHVPEDISREQMEKYQALIEADLERLQQLADQFLSGELTELPNNPEHTDVSLRSAA